MLKGSKYFNPYANVNPGCNQEFDNGEVDDGDDDDDDEEELNNHIQPSLIITGGIDPSSTSDEDAGLGVHMYNLVTDSWSELAPLPEPRLNHVAVVLHHLLFVIGGLDCSPHAIEPMLPTSTTFQYSIGKDSWSSKEDLNIPRAFHAAVVHDDAIFVFGGQTVNQHISSSAEMFSIESNSWDYIGKMPIPIMGMAITLLEHQIYLIGGISNIIFDPSDAFLLNTVFIYDSSSNSWHQGHSICQPRVYTSAVTVDRNIFVWGGLTDESCDSDPVGTDLVEVFNKTMYSWTSFTTGNPTHSMALASYDTDIYVVGGIDSNNNCASNAINNLNTETMNFAKLAELPKSLSGAAAVVITDKIPPP